MDEDGSDTAPTQKWCEIQFVVKAEYKSKKGFFFHFYLFYYLFRVNTNIFFLPYFKILLYLFESLSSMH